MDDDIREATDSIAAVREYLGQVRREADALAKVDRTALAGAALDPAAHSWINIAMEGATSFDRRQHIYMFAIVALYGCLERLVEAYITAHVRVLNRIVSRFDDLPGPVKLNHEKLTLSLLARSLENRYHRPLDHKELVGNLASCYQVNRPYHLNPEAFIHRASNCSSKQLWQLLAQIGVPSGADAAGATRALYKHWSETHDPGASPLGAREANLWLDRYVDDLVSRRNVLAHGGPVDELESVELLEDRAIALSALSEILEELFSSAIASVDIASGRAVVLGRPIQVFRNEIVAVRLSGIRISSSDILIAEPKDGPIPFRRGKILSLEVDHVRHDLVEPTSTVDVAVRVAFHAKINYNYYLLPTEASLTN